MLDYIFSYFSYLFSSFLVAFKFIFVKFFLVLIIVILNLSIFFMDVSWNVAKEFIELTDFSYYMSGIYSALPPDVYSLFSTVGIFDFIVFVFTAYVVRQ